MPTIAEQSSDGRFYLRLESMETEMEPMEGRKQERNNSSKLFTRVETC